MEKERQLTMEAENASHQALVREQEAMTKMNEALQESALKSAEAAALEVKLAEVSKMLDSVQVREQDLIRAMETKSERDQKFMSELAQVGSS